MSVEFYGRTLARSQALQLLFQAEANNVTVQEVLDQGYVLSQGPLEAYGKELALGSDLERTTIDQTIEKHTVNWKIDRLNPCDRNLLRLALYEILYVDEVDVSITINEVVRLAKYYGTDESSRFVNGLLGQVAGEL